jgi:hypothetical protein
VGITVLVFVRFGEIRGVREGGGNIHYYRCRARLMILFCFVFSARLFLSLQLSTKQRLDTYGTFTKDKKTEEKNSTHETHAARIHTKIV